MAAGRLPSSITREPEQVKAFRDTWRDGIHSYLTYLRDRQRGNCRGGGFHMSALVELQDRIQSTNALIAEHERAAVGVGAPPPRSLLANIRALEKLKRRLESEYLGRWGTRTTGEILNYVYFQTEPMEEGIRNQPLDFPLISTARHAAYSRSSSGKSPAAINKLREQFKHRQSERKAESQRPFSFTPPKYDEEYFEAMAKIESA